jgi:pilus assembly protein Flp/PilA
LLIFFEQGDPVRTKALIKRFLADEAGATAIEYALVLGIMSLAVVAIFATGGALDTLYNDRVNDVINGLGGGGDGSGGGG